MGTPQVQAVRPSPDDVSTMLLSGGTTSVSKLIPRTHNDYVLNARLCSEAAGFDRSTVFMAILPLGHNYNLASPGLLGTFHACGTVVIAPNADIETIFATIERERVSVSRVELKRPWRDGTTHRLFEPVEFLEKLAALTPRPEINLALYHVVLAPPRALAARRRRLSPHRG